MAEARDLNDAWRPLQSKDQLDTRPPETATSRENVQQGKATMSHPMRKINVEVSHTLHKNRRIQQNNYLEEKDSVTRLESKRRGPGIPIARRFKLSWTLGSDNIGRTGMDLKSEVEAWKFMSSIITSKHQETTHLPKGAWSQNV